MFFFSTKFNYQISSLEFLDGIVNYLLHQAE
jgi:hypothetical protein